MNSFRWARGKEHSGGEIKKGDTVCVFGAGLYGMWASYFLQRGGVTVKNVFDNNVNNVKLFGNVDIVEPMECDNNHMPIVIAVSDLRIQKELLEQAKNLGYTRIYTIDSNEIDLEKNMIPDYEYLKIRYFMRMGRELNLEAPRTFNEKLNWIKLYDRKPIYTTMVDKFAAKSYVSKLIGKEYVVPTIGIYDSWKDICFDKLPKQFVLKCTHDSGSVIICRDKDKFDFNYARKKLNDALEKDYYLSEREWPYKDVPRKILAEEYIDSETEILDVYKIFNFMGKPELIQMVQDDKTENETIDYFDTNWNLLSLKQNFPNSINHRSQPKMLKKMLELASILSDNIPFLRTDFYAVKDKILFSEFTFFSDSGYERFYPEFWDDKLGQLIIL